MEAVADVDGCRPGLAMGLSRWRGQRMLSGDRSELVFPRKVTWSEWGVPCRVEKQQQPWDNACCVPSWEKPSDRGGRLLL